MVSGQQETGNTEERAVGHGNDKTFAIVVYLLYAAAFFAGITALVGVIMAHVKYGDASEWVKTHLRYQIRTFYISLGAVVLGAVLSIIFIGWLVLLAWFIWAVMRVVVGLIQITADKPIPNPAAWGTGL